MAGRGPLPPQTKPRFHYALLSPIDIRQGGGVQPEERHILVRGDNVQVHIWGARVRGEVGVEEVRGAVEEEGGGDILESGAV